MLLEIESGDYFKGFAVSFFIPLSLSLSFSFFFFFVFPFSLPLIPFVVHLSSRNLGCSFHQFNLSLALES